MSGGRDCALPTDDQHGARELSPEHIAAERQADLLLEQVRESARRQERQCRGVLDGHPQVVRRTNRREYFRDPLVEAATGRGTGTQSMNTVPDERASLQACQRVLQEL